MVGMPVEGFLAVESDDEPTSHNTAAGFCVQMEGDRDFEEQACQLSLEINSSELSTVPGSIERMLNRLVRLQCSQ